MNDQIVNVQEEQPDVTTNDAVMPEINEQFDFDNILTRYIRMTINHSRGIRQKQKNRALNKRQKESRKANRKK